MSIATKDEAQEPSLREQQKEVAIMIVDDTQENLLLLADILHTQGYQVRPTDNPKLALASALAKPPDLILLDVKMPVMSGFELCSHLKQDARTAQVPVIFVSAQQELDDRVKGFEVGGLDFISKPVQREEVLARIATHIELFQLRQNLEQKVQERTQELHKSEAKFRRLVEGLKDEYFFYSHTIDGNFKYLSPSVEQVLGYSVEEFAGNYLKFFTSNKINQQAMLAKNACINGEIQPPYELEIYRKNSDKCWLEMNESPLFDDDGEVVAIEGIAHDITQRKIANEALKASQERLEEAQRIAKIGSWELDLRNLNFRWSKEAYSVFGLEDEGSPLTLQVIKDAIHPDDWPYVRGVYSSSFEAGDPFDIKHRIIRKSTEEIRYVHARSITVTDNEGEAVFSLGTVQDVTDQYLAEEARLKQHKELQRSLEQTVQAVALMVEQRDPYTAGHQHRVAEIAMSIGEEMGLAKDQIKGIFLGGVIHDIGKIYVPAEILNRPGKLTDYEFNIMKEHPHKGYEIMRTIDLPWPVATMILQHHERMDGSGYPQGLTGEKIILEARILAVADVLEAISSHRPYRPALGLEVALDELMKNREKLYDKEVVDSCINLLASKNYKLPE